MSNTFPLSPSDPRHPDALALAIVASALRAVSADYARPRARTSQVAAVAEGALHGACVVAESPELRALILDLCLDAARAAGEAIAQEDSATWRSGYAAGADVQGRVAA